jgi:hypothetical protein
VLTLAICRLMITFFWLSGQMARRAGASALTVTRRLASGDNPAMFAPRGRDADPVVRGCINDNDTIKPEEVAIVKPLSERIESSTGITPKIQAGSTA